ncbi:MAG: nuclear transport factor 2 family protein [Gammaproteobacteria bacterium]
MSKVNSNKLLTGLTELLNTKSVTEIENFLSQEINYWDPSVGTIIGINAINTKITEFWISNPKCNIAIDVVVGNDDVVVAELSYPGYETDSVSSIKFSTVVCKLENDRIISIKNYFDPQN